MCIGCDSTCKTCESKTSLCTSCNSPLILNTDLEESANTCV